MIRCSIIAIVFAVTAAEAGSYLPAGDTALRQDIQRLADYDIIKIPVTTWPLAWGPVLSDLRDADVSGMPQSVLDALFRVKQRANWETRVDEVTFDARVGLSDNASRIRAFQETPRGRGEVSLGLDWNGERFSADLNVQYVDSTHDDEIRADNSRLAVAVGNWSIAASTMNRWWGPGWDGSLILSSNARPIPSLTIDRIFSDPFESRWLSWIGPWDFNVMFGQFEEERAVPNAKFFGMRFNFRPHPALEIGLSRAAQWCGEGRPCDVETFFDLLIGRDNRGDDGIDPVNEPGNQLAGLDFRWSPNFFSNPIGIYGQFIGEDEAGGLPSRFIGQVGIDWSGYMFDRWSSQVFAEFAGTACQFHESSKRFNCAYNQIIYETGYRFRGPAVGHGADNDAELISVGLSLVDREDTQWRALLRIGELNAGGEPDPRNTVTATPQDIVSFDLSHSRVFSFGVIDLGIGFESIDDEESGESSSDSRVYLQWRSSY